MSLVNLRHERKGDEQAPQPIGQGKSLIIFYIVYLALTPFQKKVFLQGRSELEIPALL